MKFKELNEKELRTIDGGNGNRVQEFVKEVVKEIKEFFKP